METYDLVDALQAHQGQRHFRSCWQTSETCSIRRQPHYGIFRNGAGLCQGFRASQKFRRRSHSSPGLRHKFRSLLFLFSLQPHVRT